MDNLSIAKQEIKLMDLIPGVKEHINGDEYFVNPCPICGHREHFVINSSGNYYISHSRCCKGGTIVDWLVEYEKMSVPNAIKKILNDSGLGLVDKNKIKKINEENAKKMHARQREEKLVNKLYHRLSTMFRILREIDNKDAFLLWLMNFLDSYTNFFIESKNHDARIKLVHNFKKELDMQYKNFLGVEKYINEKKEKYEKSE